MHRRRANQLDLFTSTFARRNGARGSSRSFILAGSHSLLLLGFGFRRPTLDSLGGRMILAAQSESERQGKSDRGNDDLQRGHRK